MKYIEVTAWGNNKKHLTPLNKIQDFSFDKEHTTITFISGQTLNIIEDEDVIKGMLEYHGVDLIDEEQLNIIEAQNQIAYENMSQLYMADEDELPF